MALRNIRINEDPILRKTSRRVEELDQRTQTLIDDMFETMYDAGGVGLAAVQVGVLKQIIVIDTDEPGEKLVLINPEIIDEQGEQQTPEGCLSIPGRSGIVKRPETVTVRAMDREGNIFEKTGKGLLAKAFCHEIDHLSGVLYIDKIDRWLSEE
ncbi:MAG: peptide deformylase [Lachnospiraceae bacterium]|jgi:peptide deformylase|nr:peptide deformylase [Lachnospiraceae bacterium]